MRKWDKEFATSRQRIELAVESVKRKDVCRKILFMKRVNCPRVHKRKVEAKVRTELMTKSVDCLTTCFVCWSQELEAEK